jgi:hypothetical protein
MPTDGLAVGSGERNLIGRWTFKANVVIGGHDEVIRLSGSQTANRSSGVLVVPACAGNAHEIRMKRNSLKTRVRQNFFLET